MKRFDFFSLLASAILFQFTVAEVVFVAELFRHGARSSSTNRIQFDRTYGPNTPTMIDEILSLLKETA